MKSKGFNFNRERKQFDAAWREFFADKPDPKSEKEEKKQMQNFVQWYNRKYGKNVQFSWDGAYVEVDELIDDASRLLDQRKFSAAIKKLELALKIVPDNDEILSMIAEAHMSIGNMEEFKKYLEKLRSTNPNNSHFFLLNAHWNLMQMDIEGAMLNVDSLLRLEPKSFDGLITKAQLLYWQGNPAYHKFIVAAEGVDKKRAKRFMKKFWFSEVPKEVTLIHLTKGLEEANGFIITKKYNEAIGILMNIKELPVERDTREMIEGFIIDCYLCLHKEDEAMGAVQRLLHANQENPHAHLYLAKLQFDQGNVEQALKTIDVCIRCAEKHNIPHFDYYLVKGKILKTLGREYKEWEKKGTQLRIRDLNELKRASKKAGIVLEEKDGYIFPRSESFI